MRSLHGETVRGVAVDAESRCAHYDTDRDVVAFRFACCESYFSCVRCHVEVTDHDPEPWPRSRFDEPAVLCGRCGARLTPHAYLNADYRCPDCDGAFNPGCAAHLHHYLDGY